MQEVIHSLWVTGTPSLLIQRCLTSLSRSGCAVHLYSYTPDALPELPGITICAAQDILPQSAIFTYQHGASKGSVAAFANLFRYALLYQTGGWWLDADIYCLRRFAYDMPYFFSKEAGRADLIHNGVIKVPPKSPVMLVAYKEAQAIPPERLQWGDTGSKLCTRLINKQFTDLKQYVNPANIFCPYHWLHIEQLVRNPATMPPCHTSLGVHLFNEMWRRKKLDPNSEYPVYSWLQQQGA